MQDRHRTVQARLARVLDATRRHTLSVQFLDTEAIAEDCPLAAPWVSAQEGGWLGAMPRAGDLALMVKPYHLDVYLVVAFVPYAALVGAQDPSDPEALPRRHFEGEMPPALPGDVLMAASRRCFVAARQGGTLEVQVDPLCQLLFLQDARRVQLLSESLLLQGFWGEIEGFTHREASRDLVGATPVGLRARIKTIAQGAPNIALDLGAVLDEERLPLPGRMPIAEGVWGRGVCVRFLVFDQEVADTEAGLNLVPADPRRAVAQVRMDQAGNLLVQLKGQATELVEDRVTSVLGRHITSAGRADFTTEEGDLRFASRAGASLTARKTLVIGAGGDIVLRGRRVVVDAASQPQRFKGPFVVQCRGALSLTVDGGSFHLGADKDGVIRTGGSRADIVGGAFSLSVGGLRTPENLGRDTNGFLVTVKQGKTSIRSRTGSLELLLGPDEQPLCALRFSFDPTRQAPYVGRIELTTATGAQLILDPAGGFELGTARGKIKASATGTIQLGPDIGAPANVVTSQTLCYVTGLPLAGNPMVTVASLTPPVPGPVATPNPGVVPPSLPARLPDDLEFT